jgi:hypothetical protein
MKSSSIDLFVIGSIQHEFKEKVQQVFCSYVDIKNIKDKKYS